MKVVLKAEPPVCSADLPLEVQSISDSGLVVLSCGRVPSGLDGQLSCGQAEEGTPLRFTLSLGDRTVPLQARLVWAELVVEDEAAEIELIVDAGEEAGWEELRRVMGVT